MKVKKESRLFYSPLLKKKLGEYTMSDEESHHLVKVLRLKEGDSMQVANGRGLMVGARIKEANKKKCIININSMIEERKEESSLTIAIAPTKNIDRFEWFLEKATEIGVGAIIPFIGDHSERKIIKNERLDKIIVSAMKQSGRLWKPELKPLGKFVEILDYSKSGDKYIAHCHENEKVARVEGKAESTIVLVGPEGGFSTQELEKAFDAGFKGLSLGEFRLRSETAGMIACQLFNNAN